MIIFRIVRGGAGGTSRSFHHTFQDTAADRHLALASLLSSTYRYPQGVDINVGQLVAAKPQRANGGPTD